MGFFKSIKAVIGRYRVHLLVALLWLVMIFGIRQYMVANDLSLVDFIQQLQDTLTSQWYGPLLYIGVYMLRPVFFFPASLFTILAGNVYGLVLGFVYGLLAGTLSSLIPYMVGVWFSSKSAEKAISDEDQTLFQRFIALIGDNPFQAVLTMRLLYLPYDTVSFFAGFLRLNVLAFFSGTALGNVFGTLAFIGVGASIEGDITSGDVSFDPTIFLMSLAIWAVSIAISQYLKRRQQTMEDM